MQRAPILGIGVTAQTIAGHQRRGVTRVPDAIVVGVQLTRVAGGGAVILHVAHGIRVGVAS